MLRVRMIQKETVKRFAPAYLFDEGSTISWIPCGRKLTCSFPGIKFFYGPDTYFGEEVCPPAAGMLAGAGGVELVLGLLERVVQQQVQHLLPD